MSFRDWFLGPQAAVEPGASAEGVNSAIRSLAAGLKPIGNRGDSLAALVEAFRAEFPDEWAKIDRSPTENGLDHMIAKFKGN